MIIKTDKWEDILDHVEDWVVLDLNQVVIDGIDVALSAKSQSIRQAYKKKWRNEGTYMKHWSNLLKQWKFQLAHPMIPEWINDWKQQNNTVLALTAHPTGRFGRIKDVSYERLKPLKQFGIKFTNHFPNHTFRNLPMPHPELRSGVLMSANQLKGIVLSNFLKRLVKGDKPKHILFVDDQKSNVESIKKCCDIWNIGFKGIVYRGCHKKDEPLNFDQINKQFQHLEKTGQWISDSEFEQKMQKEESV